MKYAKFILDESGCYLSNDYSDDAMWSLVFFTDDIRHSSDFYKNFLVDPKEKVSGGNFMTIRKIKDKIHIMSHDDDGHKHPLILTPESCLAFIDEWNALIKLKMPSIMVYYDNETLFIGAE